MNAKSAKGPCSTPAEVDSGEDDAEEEGELAAFKVVKVGATEIARARSHLKQRGHGVGEEDHVDVAEEHGVAQVEHAPHACEFVHGQRVKLPVSKSVVHVRVNGFAALHLGWDDVHGGRDHVRVRAVRSCRVHLFVHGEQQVSQAQRLAWHAQFNSKSMTAKLQETTSTVLLYGAALRGSEYRPAALCTANSSCLELSSLFVLLLSASTTVNSVSSTKMHP
eukprot:CAMPEP_0171811922 /NCGR_PEP_ID=MMETSP0991-20121206/78393_1 /TAXON_ID=483369 /ORGANISM="non described non described, Strain CCMP2098" /LENGTH=220 /DNA_ID=CAMNT_0012425375 /DNA_START=100 /DNA_END=764 /DNA_ORIENTATION=+